MSVDYEELRRAHSQTASAEARTFQAADWLAETAKQAHGSAWDVRPEGPRQASFKTEHNGEIYVVTLDYLGHA